MSWQCKAADLRGARVEHMEEHTLALLDANWLGGPQHLAVNAEQLVADLIAFGRALALLVGLCPRLLKLFDRFARRQHVHGHVATTAEGRGELLHYKEDFPVVCTSLVLGLDIDRPCQPGIGAAVQIGARCHMGMIEAKACWLRHEGDPLHAARRREGRALLRRSVYIARDYLPVPMHELRHVGIVVDIDDRVLAFLETDQRSRKLAVV